ncbi:MAG TPA: DUF177 domain-containing protein [Sphingomonas sp.]|jgi:uncharacterized metal-binding protein YceD (DUF177 family)|nr:DUF177 domain-containing protein [Sphingomonas sp.]
MTPEFARPVRIDTIGEGERIVEIAADAEECRRLAGRFGLLAVDALRGRFAVRKDGAAILATGTVAATVTQACSVTGDPLPAQVDEAVALRFVDDLVAGDDEVELSDDALDTLPIEGGTIDLGEAAAETMALALDPFPRSPRAQDVLRAAGVVSEDEAAVGPFGALAGLKAKLGGGS